MVYPTIHFFVHDLLFGLGSGGSSLEEPDHLRCPDRLVLGYLLYDRDHPGFFRRFLERPPDDPVDCGHR